MMGLEWSGAFLPNALNAALMIYVASMLVKGEQLLRWGLLLAAWQFFTPRTANTWLDLLLLALTIGCAEALYALVQYVMNFDEERS